jgi:large subunit ribosomal protein L15
LVNPAFLKKNQVIGNTRLPIKIVATGLLEKKVTIKGCLASKKAIELIEQAGGTMEF